MQFICSHPCRRRRRLERKWLQCVLCGLCGTTEAGESPLGHSSPPGKMEARFGWEGRGVGEEGQEPED